MVFVQLKKKSAQFSGNFTPLLHSMELPTPEGESSLSTAVQAPSSEPIKKKVKRTAKGTVPPKVKTTPVVTPQVLPLEPVATLNLLESPQSISPYIPENTQRDNQMLESASFEAAPLDQRLSPKSPGSYHPEMPPTHLFTQAQGPSTVALDDPHSPTTQTLMRVVTQLQARFPDPEPTTSEVDPRSSKGVNAVEAATTVDPSQDPQNSGTGTRTSPAATHTGEAFFEALINEGNPMCQETTSGGGVRKRENGDEWVKPIKLGLMGSSGTHRSTRWPTRGPIAVRDRWAGDLNPEFLRDILEAWKLEEGSLEVDSLHHHLILVEHHCLGA
ncbi:hypothetical protein E3N88_28294 [Mikania micrantha]|uniref:Uncharacterized protein n=1 Tax=Mikania micrantha TaxID=192012 RepID=A0A5N6MZ33_9ASTR|nr:hypothetical protein E3N88_28294 [Mikania micrantha]